MERSRRNVLILASCQALYNSAGSMMAAVAALAGLALADNKALATLPVSTMWIGTALSTYPASLGMRYYGRRVGFILGCALGTAGALLAAWALAVGSFWQFAGSTFVIGAFIAHSSLYRFAAADTADEAFRPRAISLVLAGGVIAGFVGPQLAKWSKDLVAGVRFQGSYLVVAALCVLSIGLLSLIDIPRPARTRSAGDERALWRVAVQPTYVVAVMSAMVGYGVMHLLMTGTPLAMTAQRYPFDDAATVIQWHVVAMFLPSFFTGNLISRFGVFTIILTGAALDYACLVVAYTGSSFLHYWTALVLVGVGWNFLFIGGTTLLTRSYTAQERNKAQGLNDLFIYLSSVSASLVSGQLLATVGWQLMLGAALPFLLAVTMAVLWLAWRGERALPIPAASPTPQPAGAAPLPAAREAGAARSRI